MKKNIQCVTLLSASLGLFARMCIQTAGGKKHNRDTHSMRIGSR